MSKRLFVDVDDTLVLYENDNLQNSYGVFWGVAWRPNEVLIKGMRDYRRDNPNALIIMWSGGGREYAKMFAGMLHIEDIVDAYYIKDDTTAHLVTKNSIVVDDMDMMGRTHRPFEWPEPEEDNDAE